MKTHIRWRVDASKRCSVEDIHDVDAAATRAVGRRSEDSGYGFGARDHGWTFKTEQIADRIAARLKLAGFKATVSIEL